MGHFRFQLPKAETFDKRFFDTSFITGIEGIPWAGRTLLDREELTIERTIDESGKLSMVWPTAEYGPITLSTASLRAENVPYQLAIELARGTLHRVRGRALDWQRQGLKLNEAFCQQIELALSAFLDAVLAYRDPEKAASLSQRSIELTMAASRPLVRTFVQQSLAARQQRENRIGSLLGVRLESNPQWQGSAEKIASAINMASIGLEWGSIEADSGRTDYDCFDQQIEWAHRHQLRVCGGPLVSLQPHAMPKWLFLLDDFETLLDAACEFARKTVLRYKGKVHLWNAATGLNAPNDLGFTDEQLLRLAVGVIQTIRRTDDRTPVVLTLDMPWAEYLGRNDQAISPLHFADALIRADLGLSGLGLEFNMNCWPNGTLPHDLIDLADLIDHWAMLGLPLMATLCVARDAPSDPKATLRGDLVDHWSYPEVNPQLRTATATGRGPSALEMIELLLAKPNVHGIIWSQLNDQSSHHFPNAGLLNTDGNPRTALESLVELRRNLLQ